MLRTSPKTYDGRWTLSQNRASRVSSPLSPLSAPLSESDLPSIGVGPVSRLSRLSGSDLNNMSHGNRLRFVTRPFSALECRFAQQNRASKKPVVCRSAVML